MSTFFQESSISLKNLQHPMHLREYYCVPDHSLHAAFLLLVAVSFLCPVGMQWLVGRTVSFSCGSGIYDVTLRNALDAEDSSATLAFENGMDAGPYIF